MPTTSKAFSSRTQIALLRYFVFDFPSNFPFTGCGKHCERKTSGDEHHGEKESLSEFFSIRASSVNRVILRANIVSD